jgi:hypothetical protein
MVQSKVMNPSKIGRNCFIMKEELKRNILAITTKEELHEAFELLRRMQVHLNSVAGASFKIGDKVSFVHKEVKCVGVVRKINPTTIKVFVEKMNTTFRCSSTLLKKEP